MPGPSAAWTCALAAALVEMVCAVSLRKEPQDASAVEARRERAAELRASALALAELDIAAYREVLAVARRRGEAGHVGRPPRGARGGCGPPGRDRRAGRRVTRLAAEAAEDARGGIRGEAITAAVLGEAVARAGVSIVELNLAAAPEDPRLARVRERARGRRRSRSPRGLLRRRAGTSVRLDWTVRLQGSRWRARGAHRRARDRAR